MSNKKILKNMSWLTLISGVERIGALLQTVIVARVLGITDYGVYGLIFGTIGLTASVVGLQMGLTATVFVARYRETEKSKAAFVITFVKNFGFIVALLFLLCTIPFSDTISLWLIGVSTSNIEIIEGCLLIAFSIISGVQDGVIHGFEDFRSVAIIRLITTILTMVGIYPAGVEFGLQGIMCVILFGLLIKYLLLTRTLRMHIHQSKLPAKGEGLNGKSLMWGFSIPSMLVSLLVGVIGWSGIFALSRQENGFDTLAIVNTGIQWRSPIFLLTSIIASVAIPTISRYFQNENHSAIQKIHKKVLFFNGGFALLVSVILIFFSPLILRLYGSGFSDGSLIFSLMIVSAIPQVIANVYQQQLVAKGKVWQQFFLHLWLVIPLGVGFATMIPRFHSKGFALVNFVAWSIFATVLAFNARTSTSLSTKKTQ